MLYESSSEAADYVRAELSGLPPGKWENRLFMVLQVFFDDSGNAPDQELFVLGGLLSTAKKWVAFAREWEEALDVTPDTPKIDYVKYREIVRMEGQFSEDRGWTVETRDARLRSLVDIICRRSLAYLSVSVRHEDFNRYIRDVPAGFRSLLNDAPNVMAAGRSLIPTAIALDGLRLRDKCDFYFDTAQGVDDLVFQLWPGWISVSQIMPREILSGKHPPKFGKVRFEDDQEFLPLQGSDLIAGLVRDVRLLGGAHPAFKPLEEKWSHNYEMTPDDLADSGAELQRRFQRLRERFPDAELYPYDARTAARTRKKLERKRRDPRPRKPRSSD